MQSAKLVLKSLVFIYQLWPKALGDVEVLLHRLVAAGAPVAAGEPRPEGCRNVAPLVGVVGSIRDLIGVGLGDRLGRDRGLQDLHAGVDVIAHFRRVQAGFQVGGEERLDVAPAGSMAYIAFDPS